jgi:hypothetical protein
VSWVQHMAVRSSLIAKQLIWVLALRFNIQHVVPSQCSTFWGIKIPWLSFHPVCLVANQNGTLNWRRNY